MQPLASYQQRGEISQHAQSSPRPERRTTLAEDDGPFLGSHRRHHTACSPRYARAIAVVALAGRTPTPDAAQKADLVAFRNSLSDWIFDRASRREIHSRPCACFAWDLCF